MKKGRNWLWINRTGHEGGMTKQLVAYHQEHMGMQCSSADGFIPCKFLIETRQNFPFIHHEMLRL